jgi:hypothetical protein
MNEGLIEMEKSRTTSNRGISWEEMGLLHDAEGDKHGQVA